MIGGTAQLQIGTLQSLGMELRSCRWDAQKYSKASGGIVVINLK